MKPLRPVAAAALFTGLLIPGGADASAVATSVPPAASTAVVPTCDGVPATIVGSPGDDVLFGTGGDDVIFAGDGNDEVSGGGGDDRVCGGAGNDQLFGGVGTDRLFGDDGSDVLFGGDGDDRLDGGGGVDTASFFFPRGPSAPAWQSASGEGSDTLISIETLTGSSHGDELFGDDDANLLVGGDGDDRFVGGEGDDTFSGGDGSDTVDFEFKSVLALTGVTVNLAAGTAAGEGDDTLSSVENVMVRSSTTCWSATPAPTTCPGSPAMTSSTAGAATTH